jgi:hypothetical protein
MNLDRRQFLQSAGAAIAAAPALLGQRPRRPNVLVVLADEWRAQATGYNGDRNVSAPVLDRLETESVNFGNALSGCAVYTREGAIRAQRGMRSRILHVSCYSGFGNSRHGNISFRVAV